MDRSGHGLTGSSFLALACKNQGKPSNCSQESLWDKIWPRTSRV